MVPHFGNPEILLFRRHGTFLCVDESQDLSLIKHEVKMKDLWTNGAHTGVSHCLFNEANETPASS